MSAGLLPNSDTMAFTVAMAIPMRVPFQPGTHTQEIPDKQLLHYAIAGHTILVQILCINTETVHTVCYKIA